MGQKYSIKYDKALENLEYPSKMALNFKKCQNTPNHITKINRGSRKYSNRNGSRIRHLLQAYKALKQSNFSAPNRGTLE
jgi:hypothetical protein